MVLEVIGKWVLGNNYNGFRKRLVSGCGNSCKYFLRLHLNLEEDIYEGQLKELQDKQNELENSSLHIEIEGSESSFDISNSE
jgi:hypothetical protein